MVSFVAGIGSANLPSMALFASLDFEAFEVEMRVPDCVAQSWPAGHV